MLVLVTAYLKARKGYWLFTEMDEIDYIKMDRKIRYETGLEQS